MSEYAEVRIRWLPSAESGRTTSVQLTATEGRSCKPHFRVGPHGEYLGVAFVAGEPALAPPGSDSVATVALIYVETGVDYAPLAPDAEFDVLEGARIIGRGSVVRRWREPGDWRQCPTG